MCSNVDLPDPLGPMILTNSPRVDGEVNVPQDVCFTEPGGVMLGDVG